MSRDASPSLWFALFGPRKWVQRESYAPGRGPLIHGAEVASVTRYRNGDTETVMREHHAS